MAGVTRVVDPGSMGSPLTLRTVDGAPMLSAIRSFTVGNLSQFVYVDIYLGQNAVGNPYYTIPPQGNVTMPVAPQASLTFLFRTLSSYDEPIYVHVDETPLAASGFQSQFSTGPFQAAVNGFVTLFGGIILQWGSLTVAADGSGTSAIIFPESFPNGAFQVVASIDAGINIDAWALSIQTSNLTKNGCTVGVSGGPPGSAATVRFMATGN